MLRKAPVTALPHDALEALGNAERRRIIESLAGGPRSVGELAAGLPISFPCMRVTPSRLSRRAVR